MRAMASIKRRNGGAPKLSPAVLFLERLSYFTDLLKTTCLQRQGRKERGGKKERKLSDATFSTLRVDLRFASETVF